MKAHEGWEVLAEKVVRGLCCFSQPNDVVFPEEVWDASVQDLVSGEAMAVPAK